MSREEVSAPRVVDAADPQATALAAAAIRTGHVVALPTETVYGLACSLTGSGIHRLLVAKGRPANKGITLLVDSLAQVEMLAVVPAPARRLADHLWPGALTLVLRPRPDAALPELLTGGQPGVGFRLPDHAVPRAVARELGPLPLTSANLSGAPDATDARTVVRTLGRAVSLVLDGRPSPGGVPSTVVAVLDPQADAVVLRQGAVAPSLLAAALADPGSDARR